MADDGRLAGGAWTLLLAALVLAQGEDAAARPVDRWASQIQRASSRFGVPEHWVRRVIEAESGGRSRTAGPIVSRTGARGLMQLMPGTWNEMRAILGLGSDPDDPADNILAGTFYLRLLYERFGYPGLFAAYNAGPARYAAFLSGARPLPAETRSYLASFVAEKPPRLAAVANHPGTLFAPRSGDRAFSPQGDPYPRASRGTLFVALRGPAAR